MITLIINITLVFLKEEKFLSVSAGEFSQNKLVISDFLAQKAVGKT